MSRLQITYLSPDVLIENPRNARTHSAKQIGQIARSIASFGFNSPVLIDRGNMIVCGHGRVAAAKTIGLREVPTVLLDHLTQAQKRAFILADNRTAELSDWNELVLAQELEEILELDCTFEITDIGFEMPRIDVLIEESHTPGSRADLADQPVDLRDVPPVTRSGDLWLCGRHRIFCGDALDPLSYRLVLGDEKAQMVFIDPPYNVPIEGHVSGLGKAHHPEFAMASGEMSSAQFTQFLQRAFKLLGSASVEGSVHFVCMDWRHLPELLAAGQDIYSTMLNLCVWTKSQGGMGSLYRSQHELVAVFKFGRGAHVSNVELGKHGRNRTNVWSYPGMNSFQKGRREKLAMHPTVKPVALVADAMLDCSKRGGLILDAFGGSGTTAIAAERTGRTAALIELDPRYVDVALRRFCDVTGIEPVNAWTGSRVERRTAAKAA
jgi:DNA modification methylase